MRLRRLAGGLGRAGARRNAVWLLFLAAPLLGLWLLRARPNLDVRLEHHAAHFWIVVTCALVSVVLSVWVGEAARHRGDARLLLVSLTFLCSAGFLLLHALATPNVLLAGRNTGFLVATPVGLFLGAWFAAASSASLGPRRAGLVLRWQGPLRAGVTLVLLAWGVASLLELPPFDVLLAEDATNDVIHGLSLVGVGLYAVAATRYARLLHDRPSRVALAVAVAFALLAESMIAIAFAHSWHASWWEWHVLMAVAFGLVAWSARGEYARESTPARAFDAIALEQTVRRIHEQYDAAVQALVTEMRRQPAGGAEPVAELAGRVAGRLRPPRGAGQRARAGRGRDRRAAAGAGRRGRPARADRAGAAPGPAHPAAFPARRAAPAPGLAARRLVPAGPRGRRGLLRLLRPARRQARHRRGRRHRVHRPRLGAGGRHHPGDAPAAGTRPRRRRRWRRRVGDRAGVRRCRPRRHPVSTDPPSTPATLRRTRPRAA
jgi:hypothetical protein